MFKDYKSNYCPQARMSNYVKLWLKTAQLSVSSLGGSHRSRAHAAWPEQGVAPEQCCSPAGTQDRHRDEHGTTESREKLLEKGEREKWGGQWK